MSEEFEPEVLAKRNQEVEEDPLAELARIVAGEPEPGAEPEGSQQEELIEPAAVQEGVGEEQPVSQEHADLESLHEHDALSGFEQATQELEALLEQEFTPSAKASATQPAVDTEDQLDSFAYELEQAISPADHTLLPEAEHDALPEAEHDPSPEESEGIAEVEAVEENPAPAEGNFQDDLISALQEEIEQPTTSQAEPASPVETEVGEFVEAESQVVEETTQQPDLAAVEAPAEVAEYVPEEPVEYVPEESGVMHDTGQPLESVQQSPEEDLGAVFANEFEQMLANEPHQTEPAVPVDQPSQFNPDPLAQTVQEPQEAQELDFSSAFAEELGIEKVTEAEGWGTDDTASANADFVEAAQPNAVAMDQRSEDLQFDPGHAGHIPAVDDANIGASNVEQSGGSKKYAVAALIIALFAGTIVTGYGFLGGADTTGTSEPALIKADAEPFKVKPDDPGGRVPANQDNASYEKVAGEDANEVEQARLISETEEPANIAEETLQVVEEAATNLATKSAERLASNETASAPADTNASSSVTPRVVETVTVKPDGTILTGNPSSSIQETVSQEASNVVSDGLQVASNAVSGITQEAEALANSGLAVPKPVETVTIKKPEETPASVATKPEAIDGASSTGNIAVPQASPLPKPAPAPKPVETAALASQPQATATPEPAPAVRKSEWVVQVSSQRSPEAAQSSFQNLRNRFAALQGRSMSIQRANVNGATFYRVRVQTESRSDANQLCSSLQASGGSCFVTR
ncbi:MAG: SPOR domain-containing protein [Pseudomonadota bacterium]